MEDIQITDNLMTFYFPFSYRQKEFKQLTETLQHNQFQLFHLDEVSTSGLKYESDLNHELDQFFYPFIQEKLFTDEISQIAYNRFCQSLEKQGTLQTKHRTIRFVIERLDIIVCPFETGILSIVIRIPTVEQLSDVIDFMRHFRQLVPEPKQKQYLNVEVDDKSFTSTQQLLYEQLIPFLPRFFEQANSKSGYIGSLPYFEDERMYTTCLLQTEQRNEITTQQLYRTAHLDGRKDNGEPEISSFNEKYMERYIEEHSYLRWAPYLYVTTTMQSQAALGKLNEPQWEEARRYFASTGYYNVLIHYFYKIVLLKLSYEHSEIRWSTDKIIAESLIEKITLFSSKYYFKQVAIRSSGRDLSRYIRKQMRIDELFIEVKESVNDLYRVLEDENAGRYNQLLFILTVYTVISGIIGMNLVVEDWEKPIDWGNLNFLFFEWIAFITGISGIWLSFALIVGAAIRLVVNFIRKKNH